MPFDALNDFANSAGYQQFGDALRKIGAADTARLQNEHMEKVFAANPEYAKLLYAAKHDQQQNARLSKQDVPAALQLANEWQAAVNSGNMQRANAIREFAKTLDKGVVADPTGQITTMPGYGGALGQLAAAKEGAAQEAKKQIDLRYNPAIAGGEAEAKLSQEQAFAPSIEAGKTSGRENAQLTADRERNYSKANMAMKSLELTSKTVADNVDKALSLAQNSATATGYGQFFSPLPETDARALNNYLSTIKANIGFDKLQQMRDNSPTGGALGQVSEFENKLLQAVNGALDPKQKDQLIANLSIIKEMYPLVLAERKEAFEHDYGNVAKKSAGGSEQIVLPNKLPTPAAARPTPEQIRAELLRRRGGK